MNEERGRGVVSDMNEALGEAMTTPERLPVLAVSAPDPTLETFRALSSRHLDSAFRLACAILDDDEDAADATQDAFASAWQQRATLRQPDRFDAWFGRILVNACRDWLRQRARRAARAGDADWEALWVADTAAATSQRDELGGALASLDPDHRIVVILRFWADLTVDDIAERMGIPGGTVKSRLHHAIATLRRALEETS